MRILRVQSAFNLPMARHRKPTNLTLDEKILDDAMQIAPQHIRSKSQLVEMALLDLISRARAATPESNVRVEEPAADYIPDSIMDAVKAAVETESAARRRGAARKVAR